MTDSLKFRRKERVGATWERGRERWSHLREGEREVEPRQRFFPVYSLSTFTFVNNDSVVFIVFFERINALHYFLVYSFHKSLYIFIVNFEKIVICNDKTWSFEKSNTQKFSIKPCVINFFTTIWVTHRRLRHNWNNKIFKELNFLISLVTNYKN